MTDILAISFETGMILGGSFAIVGYVIGLCINLLNEYKRGVNLMTEVTTAITTEFGEIVTGALVVLGSVAGAGLILFGGIYAWKYGKKVFSVIAK